MKATAITTTTPTIATDRASKPELSVVLEVEIIVYVAEAILLYIVPFRNALAVIVPFELTEIGPVYAVDEEVGSEPLWVYFMLVPEIEQFLMEKQRLLDACLKS